LIRREFLFTFHGVIECRLCIERWLAQGNRTCPVTGMRLRHLELTPNFALRNAIQVASQN
jgi:hypothetical protein